MQTTLALVAALASVASAVPAASAPAGCSASYPGTFDFVTYKAGSAKRDLSKRVAACTFQYTLDGNVFKDNQGRSAEIVANHQFQFDPEPQAGYISTGPWSACQNGSIALGGSTLFYQCEKETNVYDIYDNTLDPNSLSHCEPVTVDIIPCSGGTSSSVVASQATDGQPQVPAATQLSDGQPQASAPASAPSQLPDGQPQVPAPSQLPDGQVQAPAPASAYPSQLSDGQPQAPTAVPHPATLLSDGQPQVGTPAPVPASQLPDGQPQVPAAATSTQSAASQLSDGQPQVPSATSKPQVGNTTTPVPFTGAGNAIVVGSSFTAAFLALVVALL